MREKREGRVAIVGGVHAFEDSESHGGAFGSYKDFLSFLKHQIDGSKTYFVIVLNERKASDATVIEKLARTIEEKDIDTFLVIGDELKETVKKAMNGRSATSRVVSLEDPSKLRWGNFGQLTSFSKNLFSALG